MPIPFADMPAVRASAFRHTAAYCRIAGVAVPILEAHPSHGVDQPVGTCRFVIPAPRPSVLTIGADVEIELGYFGYTRRRFYGSIPEDEMAITEDTYEITIFAEGRGSFLRDADAYGMVFAGPVSLKEMFRSGCEARSVDNYFSEETTLPSGSTIMLGGVEEVDGGDIIADSRISPLNLLTRASRLFGYRTYDRPDGQHTQSRVSGLPNPTFDEGILTAELVPGDYVCAVGNANIRSGAGLSFDAVGIFATGGYGMISGDLVVEADGYQWQQIRAFGVPEGWVTITTPGDPRFTTQIPRQPIYWLTQGEHAYEYKHSRSSGPMATYFDVRGARYQDENGLPTAIRSIPAAVGSAPELRPLGYRMEQYTDQLLVTPELAEGSRQCSEIDRSSLAVRFRVETQGEPDMQPGEIAVATWTAAGVHNELQWIMHVDDDFAEDDYITTVDLWAGGGEALPAGDDCRTETITNDVIHFGNETLSHYRDTTPDGTDIEIPFTVTTSDYSTLILSGYLHGANTIKNNTAVDGSKFEVWQLEDPSQPQSGTNELRRVGSIDMPSHPEELSRRRNYTANFNYWMYFRVPMPGNLREGAAILHVISGEYETDQWDDGEVTQLRLTYCGVGYPVLPGTTEVP